MAKLPEGKHWCRRKRLIARRAAPCLIESMVEGDRIERGGWTVRCEQGGHGACGVDGNLRLPW
jgi:hypothetical protein